MEEVLPNQNADKDTTAPVKELSSKTKKAFALAALGALFLLTSCLLTFFLSHHGKSFAFCLYGLTAIGITVVFISLVLFFE